jgi:hypothetical protein
MNWLRSSPAFFVRCVEKVLSPCCGKDLRIIGSRKRKLLETTGESKIIVIRRLRCTCCRQIPHELPDCIVPYKRYESACVEVVVSETSQASVVAADNATLYRWRCWVF